MLTGWPSTLEFHLIGIGINQRTLTRIGHSWRSVRLVEAAIAKGMGCCHVVSRVALSVTT